MSAIAGLWRLDDRPEPAADCARMLAAQTMYGPHDGRQWTDGAVALGRRLFRTLPEDAHDRQPLLSRDGRLALVADVRIDNRDELRTALGWTADEAGQLCDAAVLLACLERWDDASFDRVAGEFACALWDARKRSLLLARDFLGNRPLHYHRAPGFFAFATMPKGLHALPEIPRAPDERTILELLAAVPQEGPRSFYRDICRVEPGHILRVTREGLSSSGFWRPRRPGAPATNRKDYIDGLRHHLDEATRSCLRGAGPAVGTHLSGGLDSAGVTATAARLLAPAGGKVVAFTAVPRRGYEGSARVGRVGDEGRLSAATAAMYPNIDHVLVYSGEVSPLRDLDRRLFLSDSPTGSPTSRVWGDAINTAARARHLTVLLTGQMGNLSLSYHGLQRLPELLRRGQLVRLWQTASALVATGSMNWRGALMQAVGPFLPDWLWQRALLRRSDDVLWLSGLRADRLTELDAPALARERGHNLVNRLVSDGFTARLRAIHGFDRSTQTKGILAGWGVDQRDPTADKRLVEYCLGIPTEFYLDDGVARALAKRALADRLPPPVLDESRRGYQGIDWHEGLTAARDDVAAELSYIAGHAPAAGMLDIERMQALIDQWPTTGWHRDEVIRNYRWMLLRCISAGHFMRKASGANR